ncbi:hypothetical protein LzC2_15950 [Planctomycetes bacterium LzC2]|uniref:Uncharacterized protein n=1 Tax=Alienimonas chondri TaxID=2681879 RepID=A0ABX1VBP3_9PLAN|nr:hypothetical protein [Alienimonas chondri]
MAPRTCAAPPVCETELVPRRVTKYARRECVTWKEVECVAYRNCREEYVEPVCKTECRTVDRGCWKRIWVPKLVTEEYTTTDYVRRSRVRRIPYTYTKQVAERCEKIVPYCATTYVPRPVRTVMPEPDCGAPDFAPRFAPGDIYSSDSSSTYYGAEAGDSMNYGGSMYGDASGLPPVGMPMPHTGVPNIEYLNPTQMPSDTSTLRPIPSDNFTEDTDNAPPVSAPAPNELDQTSMAPSVPARAAALGWSEQASRARQF